jgi:hypothetical protein
MWAQFQHMTILCRLFVYTGRRPVPRRHFRRRQAARLRCPENVRNAESQTQPASLPHSQHDTHLMAATMTTACRKAHAGIPVLISFD